jgi:hypothetical protein
MAKTKCILTSYSKEGLQKMINDFYYSKNYIITEDNKVYNTKLEKYLSDSMQVVVKKDRWQLRQVV